jgi:hypothetical protein
LRQLAVFGERLADLVAGEIALDTMAGRSGSGKAECDRPWISSGGELVTCAGSPSFVCVCTAPTKRRPFRAMVRITFWSSPLSPAVGSIDRRNTF